MRQSIRTSLLSLAVALGAIAGFAGAGQAQVGTAVPPAPGTGTPSPLSARPPVLPIPIFTAPLSEINGFTITGLIQSAVVSGDACPDLPKAQWGGTVVVNQIEITIPCNLVVQLPAQTLSWSSVFDASGFTTTSNPAASLTLASTKSSFTFPSTEITMFGNIVGGKHIAALAYISQQLLNSGVGYITGFDYEQGVIYVSGKPNGSPRARLQINDAAGRFSKGQSPDTRFNVDDENPTIRAATGYPMCLPRSDPAKADDPLCPQRNRPLAAKGCRNFADAFWTLPAGRDLSPPRAGQTFCSAFVMNDPALIGATDPTSLQQAPFEIGDYITYSGTLLIGDRKGPGGTDTISVHTVTANVGIFTQPLTQPSYIAIESARISADADNFFNGLPQESPDRLVFDAVVTDIASIVDLYLIDRDPITGDETNRWVTQRSMTGGFGSSGANGLFVDGGVTTQFTGPVPGRVRLRANKATPRLLTSPTRFVRAVIRSLCDPTNINDTAPTFTTDATIDPATQPLVPCLQRAVAAHGLRSGQFAAPISDFLFPENIVVGDRTVANNFWVMNFLVSGEGPNSGPLIPTPW